MIVGSVNVTGIETGLELGGVCCLEIGLLSSRPCVKETKEELGDEVSAEEVQSKGSSNIKINRDIVVVSFELVNDK